MKVIVLLNLNSKIPLKFWKLNFDQSMHEHKNLTGIKMKELQETQEEKKYQNIITDDRLLIKIHSNF